MASFDTGASSWLADAGTYTVKAGASSLDTRQRATFQLPRALVVEKSRPLLVPQSPVTELHARQ